MLIRIIDFETTGLTPQDSVVEVGWCDLRYSAGRPPSGTAVDLPVSMLINPGRPIPPQARAVHHIGDAEVANAPAIEVGFARLKEGAPDIFCAHHVLFEQTFFSTDRPWICTLKIGRRLWPDSPGHGNQVLRYHLGLDQQVCFEPELAMPVHRAGPDAYVTARILERAFGYGVTPQELIEWSNEPSLLPGSIHFGKHKGTPWPQVDPTYLVWMLKQDTMDEDARFTAQHWLNRRRSDDR